SDKWLQLKSYIFGRKVVSLQTSESASLGGAILAAAATKEYASVEDAVNAMVKIKKTYFPEKTNQNIYENKQNVYEKIYPAIKKLNHIMKMKN
ncbi:MAG: hypothetical protein GXP32_01350, partial [Kiritimatiellaeota bacterium]|nr:hypothetical protein [Kiritimatiellota bacterium]